MNSDLAAKVVVVSWMLLMTVLVVGGYTCPSRCDDTPTILMKYEPCEEHLVRVDVTRYMFEPMGRSWLEPIRNESYQISVENITVSGITDAKGEFVISACPTKKYRLEISDRTVWLYPSQSRYRVMLK